MASIAKSNVTRLPDAVTVSAVLNVPVFPCKHQDDPAVIADPKKWKAPFTRNGFKDATYDPYQIIKWWNKWPDALIGMPTGKTSGFVILDIDMKNGKDGESNLHDLEALYGKIETIESLTPTNGRHLWFKCPEVRVSKDNSGKAGAGIDIQGDGAYIIIPTSAGYEWEASNPDQCAEMPEWLITLCNQKPASKKPATKKNDGLVHRIVCKNGYRSQLPPISNIKMPNGRYPAKFVGWQAMQRGKFMLKKGQVRIILRFIVFAGGRKYQLNAYRTINVLHNGRMSVGASNKLAGDISAIAGNHKNGWPVQVNLDDIDISIFCDRDLSVSTHCTKKKRIAENGKWIFKNTDLPYSHISTICPLSPHSILR